MVETARACLTDDEVHSFFDQLFPNGFAGPDVLLELAPVGWERSPLISCFHPSVEQLFEEERALHRRMRELEHVWTARGEQRPRKTHRRRPTLASVRRNYVQRPVQQGEEVADLVGLCAWDIFSGNNAVIAADGRLVALGTWRGSAAFLDEYLSGARDSFREGDYLRFYMGTVWIWQRANLTPVYRLIFSRLKAVRADWRCDVRSRAFRTRKGFRGVTPATERAYRRVYGRRPRAWAGT